MVSVDTERARLKKFHEIKAALEGFHDRYGGLLNCGDLGYVRVWLGTGGWISEWFDRAMTLAELK